MGDSMNSWKVKVGVSKALGRELDKIHKAVGENGEVLSRVKFRAFIADALSVRNEWSAETVFDYADYFLMDTYTLTRRATHGTDSFSSNNDVILTVTVDEYKKDSSSKHRVTDGKPFRLNMEIRSGGFESHWGYHRYSHDGFSEGVNLDFVLNCIDKAPSIADKIPGMIEHQEQLCANAKVREVKRNKINEIRNENIMTVLERICAGLKSPYAIEELSSRIDLKIKLPGNMHFRIEIPLTKYQDILPDLQNIINDYLSVIEGHKAKVHIMNDDTKTRWISGQPRGNSNRR
jgi:hypothetical protein